MNRIAEILDAVLEPTERELRSVAYEAVIEEQKQRKLAQMFEEDAKRKARKLLELSGLGKRFFDRTFGSFEINDKNEQAYKACRKVVLGKSNGVLLTGKNGIGKTHLAAAIVNELTAQGKIVRFGNVVELMQRYGDDLTACDLTVIDDLGQAYSVGYKADDVKVYLYKQINKLYEQDRGIVITTNLDAKQVIEKYGTAILSRLHEMCEFVRYEDKDWRKGEGK